MVPTRRELQDRLATLEEAIEEARDILVAALEEDELVEASDSEEGK